MAEHATCHPHKKHYARGLCRDCYRKEPDQVEKAKQQALRWKKKNPGYWTEWGKKQIWTEEKSRKHRARKYGLSDTQWDRMWGSQNGRCGICQTELTINTAFIDHDHETGKVRGFLCAKCNSGLGLLGDNKAGLWRAMSYLEMSSG